MMTVKQMERLWETQAVVKLAGELLAARPEGVFRVELSQPLPTAGLLLVRLDELSQGFTPLASKLTRFILSQQESDGGWGDPIVTAVCLRGLMSGGGEGTAVDQGLAYLAMLQKPEGIWPRVPIRRMPDDASVSAFVLLQLVDQPRFHSAVRLTDAVDWFTANQGQLDNDAKKLWKIASLRCAGRTKRPVEAWNWS